MSKPVRAEDVLADSESVAEFGGVRIRKGSAAAFVHNVRALSAVEPGSAEGEALLGQARELAQTLAASGFFEVLAVRDERVAGLLGLS